MLLHNGNIHPSIPIAHSVHMKETYETMDLLLHNGNIHPSIPIAHSVHMKETYETMDLLLEAVSYLNYEWKMCGDLKVMGLLLEFSPAKQRFAVFLSMGQPNAKDKHYKTNDWPMRERSFPGEICVRNRPIFDKYKILLPPLHIKFFVNEMKNHIVLFVRPTCRPLCL